MPIIDSLPTSLLSEPEANLNSLKTSIRNQALLILTELSSIRLDWKYTLLIGLVSPVSFLLLLSLFVKGDNEALTYIVSGNMVLTQVTGTMLSLGQEMGVLKEIRGFDYYSTLPISKMNLVIAHVTKATLLSMPSILMIWFLGNKVFYANITLTFSSIIILLLSGYTLSAIGAVIGTRARDAEQASVITQVVNPILTFCSPVFVPENYLPRWLNTISYLFSTRYVAAALRNSMSGTNDPFPIAMVLFFCLISIFLVNKFMDWRG